MKIWKQEDWAEVPGTVADSPAGLLADGGEQTPADTYADEIKKAREKAVYYLQFSGKTENELRKKLAEKDFSPASVDSAIEFVKQYRYLDDEDYTRRFVEKNRNKKSRKQMTYELAQKGVARGTLDRVFEDMEVDEEAQILALLEKKNYPKEDAGPAEKQKISAFLARKGFSYDAISAALIQYARKN